MGGIFSGLSPASCAYQTRSVRLGAHATSIRLEAPFWAILDEIAAAQGVSLGRFLTVLHDQVLDMRGPTHNFTSLLRCACLTHASQARGRAEAEGAFELSARRVFQAADRAAPRASAA